MAIKFKIGKPKKLKLNNSSQSKSKEKATKGGSRGESPLNILLFVPRRIIALIKLIPGWLAKLIAPIVKLIDRITPQSIKKLNSNYKIALGLAVVLSVWMASGLLSKNVPPRIDPSTRSNNNIKSVLIREFSIASTERIIRLSGVSQEERKVDIKAELSSRVEEIINDEGSDVYENTSIIKLEQEEALARLRQAQSQENQARLEFNSQTRLRSQGLTSAATVSQAEANYEAARATASLMQKQYDATEVHSPFAGRVENVYVEQGDFIQPGQLLASIFDYDPIAIVGDLSELEVNYVNPGDRVVVKFITGETVDGNVSYVANTADRQTRTFEVKVVVPNPDRKLLAGITTELEFYTGLLDSTKIPASIININEEGNIGIRGINDENKVVFYPVEVVKAETNEMWVSGLPDGAKLIIRGFGFVEEGEEVKAEIEKATSDNRL